MEAAAALFDRLKRQQAQDALEFAVTGQWAFSQCGGRGMTSANRNVKGAPK
ncbi:MULTISPECIES: hypothetical protein [unclassified Rhizobium]|uniref:hypothetical protein n=1 Tax=unclassified Rhizobium TaxID=2613769 RepID=UPI000B235143|nr:MULTISPECIES: hypothetical protein [unclassified Rhizobium]